MERPLTQFIHPGCPPFDLKEYEMTGGYTALKKALGGMAPLDVQKLVQESGLKGRGGAGFNTGMKWSFVPMGDEAPHPKYLIANADEMEPGTFKDRYLMEFLPHLLIEGLVVSSFALGSNSTYIYIRGEYAWIVDILEQAIAEAKLVLSQAAATAAVDKQVEALKDQNAMIN